MSKLSAARMNPPLSRRKRRRAWSHTPPLGHHNPTLYAWPSDPPIVVRTMRSVGNCGDYRPAKQMTRKKNKQARSAGWSSFGAWLKSKMYELKRLQALTREGKMPEET